MTDSNVLPSEPIVHKASGERVGTMVEHDDCSVSVMVGREIVLHKVDAPQAHSLALDLETDGLAAEALPEEMRVVPEQPIYEPMANWDERPFHERVDRRPMGVKAPLVRKR